tara:strand:+ start:4313 stop:5188 length:876 start_codon:yes stop_codon:yes gene_type:complete
MEKIELIICEDSERRVDQVISFKTSLSRSRIQKLISMGRVHYNSELVVKSSALVKEGIIVVEIPIPEEIDIKPQNIPLEIKYEDSDIVVINKQAGLVVHSGAGRKDNTLVNALLFHVKNLSGIGDKIRPGIVHRLDKDTSGLMVIAKNDKAHLALSAQFKGREVGKKYYAVVKGVPISSSGRIETNIARSRKDRKKMTVSVEGKRAVTEYKVVKSDVNSILDVKIETGRTHQIRVHMLHIGHPIIGDEIYGKREKFDRHFLHCYELSFKHPSNLSEMTFTTDIPISFFRLI